MNVSPAVTIRLRAQVIDGDEQNVWLIILRLKRIDRRERGCNAEARNAEVQRGAVYCKTMCDIHGAKDWDLRAFTLNCL